MSYVNTINALNPVAYYRLGESSGIIAVDETGLYDGTYIGTPTLGEPGLLINDDDNNTSVSFQTGDAVEVTNQDLLLLGDVSLSMLFKTSDLSVTRGLIGWGGSSETEGDNFIYRVYTTASENVSWFHEYGVGHNKGGATLAGTISENTTHNIIYTRDDTEKTIKIYIDGEESLSEVYTDSATGGTTGSLIFGNDAESPIPADGLDEVSIFNYTLSPTQVQDIYKSARGFKDENPITYSEYIHNLVPIAYWRLGESSGTIAIDEMAQYDGTYINAPTLGEPGLLVDDADTSIKFNGIDNRVDLPAPIFNVNSLVVSGQLNSFDEQQELFASYDDNATGNDNRLLIQLYSTATFPVPSIIFSEDAVYSVLRADDHINIGDIVQVAVVYDGTDSLMYINGILQTEKILNKNVLQYISKTHNIIGARYISSTGYNYEGNKTVDELALFNYELTSTQIIDLYNASKKISLHPTTYSENVYNLLPIAYWRLGESSGTIAVDRISSYDGTYVNAPTLGESSLLVDDNDTAVSFDGVNQYITLADSFVPSGTSARSLSFSIKSSDATGDVVIDYGTATTGNRFGIYITTTTLGVYIGNANIYYDAIILDDITHNICISVPQNSNLNGIYCYVDGQLLTSINNSLSPSTAINTISNGIFNIMSNTANSGYLAGTLDDFSIYDYALTKQDAEVLYNSSKAFTSVPTTYKDVALNLEPIAYWSLGELTGTIAFDRMGNHNGTYVGSPTLGSTGLLIGDTDTSIYVNSVDQYVQIPYNTSLNTFQSFSFLVNVPVIGSYLTILTSQVSGYQISIKPSGELVLAHHNVVNVLTSIKMLQPNTTYHICINFTNTNAEIYIDGVFDISGTHIEVVDDSLNDILIGFRLLGDGGNQALLGSVDEVMIFDYQLTQGNVTELYNASIAINLNKSFDVVIDHTKVDEDLYNFPILVNLGDDSAVNRFNTSNIFDELDNINYNKISAKFKDPSLQALPEYAKEVMALKPKAYWRLGESSGTTAFDETGLYNGTYGNLPTLGTTGLLTNDVDTAVTFNGVDQYVSESNISLYDSNGNDKPLTISATINATDIISSPIISKWDNTALDSGELHLAVSNGTILFQLLSGNSTDRLRVETPNIIIANITYNIIVTYDGGLLTTGINIYVNGVLQDFTDVSSGTYVGMSNATGDADIHIGSILYDDATYKAFFSGIIDDVSIFDYDLTQDQVTRLYKKSIDITTQTAETEYSNAVKLMNPVAYWRLGESSGAIAYDEMGLYDGDYLGTPTLGVSGLLTNDVDTAMQTDGTIGDYMIMPTLNHSTTSNGFTILVTMNIQDLSDNAGLNGGGWDFFNFHTFNSNGDVYCGTDVATRFTPTDLPTIFQLNTTGTVVYTHDGTTGKFYYDGVLLATKAQFYPTIIPSLQTVESVCIYDEVAIFGRELSASEVKHLYDTSKAFNTVVDDQQCKIEIDRWDQVNQEAQLWVKVPYISKDRDTVINFSYDSTNADNSDNIGITGSLPAQNVWTEYNAVYHLSKDGADSTGNSLDGALMNMDTSNIVDFGIGKGLSFNGTNEYIDIGVQSKFNIFSTEDFNLDAQYNVNQITTYNSIFENRGIGVDTFHGWQLRVGAEYDQSLINDLDEQSYYTNDPTPLINTDTSLSYGFDNSTSTSISHLNGSVMAGNSSVSVTPNTPITSNRTTTIGRESSLVTNLYFDGILKEIRFAKNLKSNGWVSSNYDSTSDNLVTFTQAETYEIPSAISTKAFDIVIDQSKIGEDLYNFPILVNLDSISGIGGLNTTNIFDELNYNIDVNDDFTGTDGDPLNPEKWADDGISIVGVNSYSANIINNKYHISASYTGATSTKHLYTKYSISGDFDVEVEFSDLTSTQYILYFTKILVDGMGGTLIGKELSSNDTTYNFRSRLNDLSDVVIAKSSLFGKYRITRVGSIWTTYYKDGSDIPWTILQSADIGFTTAAKFSMGYFTGSNTAFSASINFDNFRVNAGTIIWDDIPTNKVISAIYKNPANVSVPDYANEMKSLNPVAYWRLGETSGTVAYDEIGDYISNKNGTYVNEPTLGVSGLLTNDVDTAMQTDTSKYMTLPLTGTTIDEYSFSCLITLGTTVEHNYIFEAINDSYAFLLAYMRDGAVAGANTFFLFNNKLNGGAEEIEVSTPVFPSTGTYHVVLTKEAGNDASTINMYIDGVKQTLTVYSNTASGSFDLTKDIVVGDSNSGTILDELSWHDRVVTQDEVTRLYNKYIDAQPTDSLELSQQCKIEIDRWDQVNQEAQLWVKVPYISKDRDTVINFSYDSTNADNSDNVGATGSIPAKLVWSEYDAVYHLSKDGADSAGLSLDGALMNMDTSNIVDFGIGKGLSFNGTNEWIDIGLKSEFNLLSTEDMTIESSVSLVDTTTAHRYFQNRGTNTGSTGGFQFISNDLDELDFIGSGIGVNGTTQISQITSMDANIILDDIINSTMTFTQNSGEIDIYTNGIDNNVIPNIVGDMTDVAITSARNTTIGCAWDDVGTQSQFMNGKLKEIRFAKDLKSDNWISSNNDSTSDSLVTFVHASSYSIPVDPLTSKAFDVIIDHSKVKEDLYNFPILVNLDSTSGINALDSRRVFTELNFDRSVDDDFTGVDGSIPDSELWEPQHYQTDLDVGNVDVTTSLLQTNTLYFRIINSISNGMRNSTYQLRGDFDIQVDFSMGTIPSSSYAFVLGITNSTDVNKDSWLTDDFVYIARWNDVSGPYRSNVKGGTASQGGTADSSGIFRLIRIGSTVQCMYWDDYQWITNSTEYYNPDDVYIQIGSRVYGSIDTLEVYYDNFVVNSGTVIWPTGSISTTNAITTVYINPVDNLDPVSADDDFNGVDGSVPNSGLWINGYARFYPIIASPLKINSNSITPEVISEYSNVISNYYINGDFDIQIDTISGGFETSDRIDLGIEFDEIAQIENVTLYRNNDTSLTWWYTIGGVSNSGSVVTGVPNTKLRITRVGNLFTYYVDVGAGWVNIHTTTQAFPLLSRVNLMMRNATLDNHHIDNFKVNSGTIVWPQPSDTTVFTRRCKVEIDRWDQTNQQAQLWVKVPYISKDRDTVINFSYDSTNADNSDNIGYTGSLPAQNVWSEYDAVYHLSKDGADSSINALDGTPISIDSSNIVDFGIGKGLSFNGTNEWFELGDIQNLGLRDLHLNMKFRLNTTTPAYQMIFSDGDGVIGLGLMYLAVKVGGILNLYFNTGSALDVDFATPIVIDTDYDVNIFIDRDGFITAYVNGILDATASNISGTSDINVTTSGDAFIGKYKLSEYPIDGLLKEFRIQYTIPNIGSVSSNYDSTSDSLLTYVHADTFIIDAGYINGITKINGTPTSCKVYIYTVDMVQIDFLNSEADGTFESNSVINGDDYYVLVVSNTGECPSVSGLLTATETPSV